MVVLSIFTWLIMPRSDKGYHRIRPLFAYRAMAGRSLISKERALAAIIQVSPLPFNRVVIEKNSRKQLVYYWFEQRGRKIANEWWSKAYLLADAIFQNRTDGALVRLTTPVYPGEDESDADKRLQVFIREFVPSLSQYLPSEPQRQAMPALDRLNVNHS